MEHSPGTWGGGAALLPVRGPELAPRVTAVTPPLTRPRLQKARQQRRPFPFPSFIKDILIVVEKVFPAAARWGSWLGQPTAARLAAGCAGWSLTTTELPACRPWESEGCLVLPRRVELRARVCGASPRRLPSEVPPLAGGLGLSPAFLELSFQGGLCIPPQQPRTF